MPRKIELAILAAALALVLYGAGLLVSVHRAEAARDEQTLTLAGAGAEETVATLQQRGAIYRKISAICRATVAGKWNFYHLRADGTTEVLAEELPNDETGADAAASDVVEWVPKAPRPHVRIKFDPTGAGAGSAFCEFVFGI